MKILALDIETRPNTALVWDLFEQRNISVDAVLEPKSIICWSAKWIGKKTVIFRSIFHHGGKCLEELWSLLDECDAVVHYNGQKFDVPHINTEFLRAGLGPPSPYAHIDLCKIIKKNFLFPSAKLKYVSKELGLGGKVEHEGFPLWVKCLEGDRKSWELMRAYNIRDVEILEPLYEKLRAWNATGPSFGAHSGTDVCPGCGSSNLESRGSVATKTGRYKRFHCKDCGRWSRATKREAGTAIT